MLIYWIKSCIKLSISKLIIGIPTKKFFWSNLYRKTLCLVPLMKLENSRTVQPKSRAPTSMPWEPWFSIDNFFIVKITRVLRVSKKNIENFIKNYFKALLSIMYILFFLRIPSSQTWIFIFNSFFYPLLLFPLFYRLFLLCHW